MLPIRFDATKGDGVHVFHYLPTLGTPVTRNWPGLFGEWPEERTPFTEWAVNNNMEEVAVYLGLVWRLTAGLRRFAIPAYYREDAERALGQTPLLVDWEYEIDAEGLTPAARDKGFVRARSAVTPRPVPGRDGRCDSACAGLFPVAAPRDLVSLLHAVIFDASSEISVFAVAPGAERLGRLTQALRRDRPPTLAGLLQEGEVFVDLTIGSDVGQYDSIMVASPTDIGERVDALVADCALRITAYESRVDAFTGVPDFLREMPRLAGVVLNDS
ncbi:hypothetical protein ABZ479_14730 [Streptomyces sp. NPDC005722]